jgi:uncharacterized membrane protein
MATRKVSAETGGRHAGLEIRTIGAADVTDALTKGIADFNARPTHLIFLCIIYPVLMILIARIFAGYDFLPFVFPIIAGSTLLGPLAACGMYELSRRREQGLETSWIHCFDVLRSSAILAIAILGIVLGVIFLLWLFTALAIYAYYFGDTVPVSVAGFVAQIFATPAGWGLIIVGSAAGFLFAVVVLAISVVSFPLILDRHVDPMTAVATSLRAVLSNPKSMALWGLIVAVALFLGALPFFIGLAVVMPVLGHATWHLYRKVVVVS